MMSCSSSGLAKNNKIMSTFVPFSRLLSPFESLIFIENGGQTLHQSSQTGYLSFSMGQQFNNNSGASEPVGQVGQLPHQ